MLTDTIRLYPQPEAAERLAAANNAADDGWTYVVEQNEAGRYYVAIYDEDGCYLGAL